MTIPLGHAMTSVKIVKNSCHDVKNRTRVVLLCKHLCLCAVVFKARLGKRNAILH